MTKPAETYVQQLTRLKSRGLVVGDEATALHVLEHHNYYRVSAYRFPFTVTRNPDQFLAGATFDQLWRLYQFDRSLRQLVLEACKRVEISVRSRWAYELGHRLGPLAYLDNRHFADPLIHAQTLVKLNTEMTRSKEEFIKHHRATLGMAWPPVWVIAEVASFGNISNLLGQTADPSLRQAVADSYQLDEKTFCSLFHHLSVVRNIAAHHSRLWNRRFVVTFQLPRKKPRHLWANFYHDPADLAGQRKLYNTLVLLVHLIRLIEPATQWPQRLVALSRSNTPALLAQMGFPADWETRPLWQPFTTTS
jgi:abortive infection bacteriophage resistance protein